MRDFLKGENFLKGFRLSTACLLLLIPNLAWKYFLSYSDYVQKTLGHDMVFRRFLADVFLIWVAIQISATAGHAWAKKPRLIGLGTWEGVLSSWKTILLLALGISAVHIVFFDFWILKPIYQMHQTNPFTSSAYLVEEVIFRFGLFAIAYRLTGSIITAVIVSAALNVFAGLPAVFHGGLKIPMALVWVAACKSLVLAVFYGYFYVKKGLLATMALRFIIGLKYVVYMFVDF